MNERNNKIVIMLSDEEKNIVEYIFNEYNDWEESREDYFRYALLEGLKHYGNIYKNLRLVKR